MRVGIGIGATGGADVLVRVGVDAGVDAGVDGTVNKKGTGGT
ncbi:hypothetical protein [Streptomyces sp. FL07-04A]|nr:hypothetical protein [Streptomyces sp. FL07-04A]MDX3576141.1 hypothetical protein [Streptomyces sp. FL07-04A]